MITIKPHHFMDIIKLYGSGIDIFVPDERMGHDFYKIANAIITHQEVFISLTIDADDICEPCRKCVQGVCCDNLPKELGNIKKDDYNKMLDQRILKYYNLNPKKQYTAFELCQMMSKSSQNIFDVWKEEQDDLTKKRYDLFCLGSQRYLEHG